MLTDLPPPRTKSGDRTLFLPQLVLVVSVLAVSTALTCVLVIGLVL
jgi:hypothetical protein